MKKALFVLAFLALGLTLKSECPPEAVDFTMTDCYGVEYNLFELLDGGRYIIVEFRTSTSGSVTKANAMYHKYGCNGQEVFLIEMLTQVNDNTGLTWINNNAVECPVVTRDGGAEQFFELHQDCMDINYYECLLISPSHEIYGESVTMNNVDAVFESFGIMPSDCNFGDCSAPINLTAELDSANLQVSWSAVDDASYYHVYQILMGSDYFLKNVYDTVCQVGFIPGWGGDYYVVSHCQDGSECVSEVVSSAPKAFDFTATDIHGKEIHLFDILDRGHHVLIDFFWYTCSSCRDIMPNIVDTYYKFGCNLEDIFYLEVDRIDNNERCMQWCEEFGVEYPTISKEGGGEMIASLFKLTSAPHYFLIAPDRSIIFDSDSPYPFEHSFSFFDLQSVIDAYRAIGIEEHQCYHGLEGGARQKVRLFPNPADGFVNLTMDESGVLRVFNALGQTVDSFVADGGQTRLDTENYPNGLYFVQMNGRSVGRFLVNHR